MLGCLSGGLWVLRIPFLVKFVQTKSLNNDKDDRRSKQWQNFQFFGEISFYGFVNSLQSTKDSRHRSLVLKLSHRSVFARTWTSWQQAGTQRPLKVICEISAYKIVGPLLFIFICKNTTGRHPCIKCQVKYFTLCPQDKWISWEGDVLCH